MTGRQADTILLASLISFLLVSRLMRAMPFLAESSLLRLAAGEAALVLPGLAGLKLYGKQLTGQLGLDAADGRGMGLGVAAVACCYPIVLILNILSMHFVRNHVAQVLPQVLDQGLLPALIVMALLPALAEEFLFRGILYRSYRQYSPLRGAVRSGLLFGLMHMDLNQFAYAAFLGIVLALMAEAVGSIWISIFMHGLFNGASVLINYFGQKSSAGTMSDQQSQEAVLQLLRESSSAQGILIMAAVSLISLLLLVLVLVKAFQKNGKSIRNLFAGPAEGRGIPTDLPVLIFICAAAGLAFVT